MSNLNFTRKGCAIIISGPSGSGKTSLSNKLLDKIENLKASISLTTRQKRTGEKEGNDYFFTDKQTFSSIIKSNQMLEYTEQYGNLYGTQKKDLIEKLNSGIDILFDLDSDGAKSLKNKLGSSAITIFIMPPSMKSLSNRLAKRSSDNKMHIVERMNSAKAVIETVRNYDFIVVNNDIEEAFENIKSIIFAERSKRMRIKNLDNIIIEFNKDH